MLLVDIGNTRIKCIRVHDNEWQIWHGLDTREVDPYVALSNDVLASPAPERVLVSNVAGRGAAEQLADFCRKTWQLEPEFMAPAQQVGGMTTRYKDPQQLGVDRWLAALAGWQQYGAVCVVDAGTALTVDIVTADGQHLGGLIAPGIDLMRQALQRGTAHLESRSLKRVEGFADNTEDAISLGCTSAVGGLLQQTRVRLESTPGAERAQWLLTGGGAHDLEPLIDWPYHADAYLVQRGLLVAAGLNP